MVMRMIDASVRQPKKLTLQCSTNQLQAALKLYGAIMKGKGAPIPSVLLKSLHSLFVSLTREGKLSAASIACPTDQLLVLLSFRPEGNYSTAKDVLSNCSALQYSFRSIIVHRVRLINEGKEEFDWYTPAIKQNEDDRNLDELEGEDEDEDETGDEEDEDETGDEEDEGENDSGTSQTEEAEAEEDQEKILEAILNKAYESKSIFIICIFKHLPHDTVGKSDNPCVIDSDSSHEPAGDDEGKSLISYVFTPGINLAKAHISFYPQSLRG